MTLQRVQRWLALLLFSWVGAQRNCAWRYFCLVVSAQTAPLGMIYDDFLGLFCKHSHTTGGSYIPRVFLHQWYCSKIILLWADTILLSVLKLLNLEL